MLFLKLHRFGVVTKLDEERGFGFISTAEREDVFFHFRGYPGRLPGGQNLPPVGTPVLFITGSDPRRPHEPKKGTVLWAPVEIAASSLGNAPTDQASLDAFRRKRLGELPREALWGTFETSWYAKPWGGIAPAPTDLVDELLGQVVCERLAEMSPADLEAHQVSRRLANSHYQFAACLSPGSPACAFTRLLEVFEPTQLAVLGAPDASWIQRGRLSRDAHSRLLEWHLLSRVLSEPRGNWESCFPGTEASEVELATRFLGYGIPRDAFIDAWLDRIVHNGLLSEVQADAWADRSPDLVAGSLFHRLPIARQDSLLSEWRKSPAELYKQLQNERFRARALLTATALAFDLETDGERVWEIGCARNEQASLLHDERSGSDLDVAMADLGRRVLVAPLVVGHNVLAWDWPIAARYIALASVPVIWDTMLIGYLLEPQTASQALGGRHHADQDALDALRLFKRQLECLPADVARRVLLGEFADSAQLLDAVIEALPGMAVSRDVPDFMTVEGASQAKLVVVPESRLRNVDWVPGVSVVSAGPSEGLAAEWREVDVVSLTKALPADVEADPAARVLVAVAQRAAAQGIALRRNMIPVWLLERDARLRSAVDMACVVPKVSPGWRIASLPASVEWWASTEPSSCVVTGLGDHVLVLDRRQGAQSDIAQTIGELPAAPFMRLGGAGPAMRWLLVDRAAHVLDSRGGLTAFTTLPVNDAAIVRVEGEPPSCRPRFARRRRHVLHPRAEDQGSYWAEVLRTFKEVVTVETGTVPILLVTSTQSRALRDLLAAGLAEIGLGELKPDHRSQREHLLRARKGGFALVDVLGQWPVWQSLAQSAGMVLQPVVEALPIEEWHACEETRTAAQTGGNSGHEAKNADGATVISGAALLESAPSLVRARLHGWMADVGLSASQLPLIFIDPRVGDMAKGLSSLVDSFQLVEAPFLAEQAQRLDLVLSPFKLVREEAPSGLEAMERFLVANWQPRSGTDGNRVIGFKPSQKIAMEAICERSANVLVSLPTGEGKSVLFQVPALCRGLRNRRLTLVLSPLKALMRDQVERLREQGFSESVDYLSGDRPPGEIAEVIQGVLDHRIVLLYVAPERTRSGVFLDVLHKRMQADKGLEHVVVDEAHCVNQWGYEFRPDYFHALNLLLRMCSAMEVGEPTPFLLLSATITASDRARLQAVMAGDSGEAGSPLPLLAKPDAFSNPLRTHISVKPRRVRGMLNDRRNFDKVLAERLPHIEGAVSAARRNRSSTGQRSAVIVFVSSRYHAEVVAQRLARATSGQVDYYHAGLDAGSREEIYTRFLDGDLDVLVATKAFGMGMDIPDIHWVVHLAPPGYLEDYLQEVGRIGRGERERKNARLEKLSATLLFSDQDFESIRVLRARGALSLPIIKDLYGNVCEHAYQVDGQQLAIVPAEGYGTPQNPMGQSPAARRAAATRVRMALYWLERAQRVRLCGSVPDLIEVTAYPPSLERISQEDGLAAEVAGLILQARSTDISLTDTFAGVGSTLGDAPDPRGIIGGMIGGLARLFSGLSDTVGLLFDGSAKTPGRSPPRPRPAYKALPSDDATAKTVVLNLSQIKLRSSALRSIGDVLAVLGDLEKSGAVSLNREIDVVPRKLASEPSTKISELFQYVDGGVVELIRQLARKGRIEFNPFEMVEDVEGPWVGDDKRRMYERSFINGFRSLARASGIKLRQLAQPDDKVIWEAVLPRSLCSKADSSRQRFLQGAKSLFAAVGNQRSIAMSKLIDQLRAGSRDGRFRESDLNKVAGLLSAMSLVSISPELVPLSHVVAVSDTDGRLEDRVDIWDELRQVNELAEARNLAMEVFANVNTEVHPAFIEGYFDTADGSAVRQFLDTQLGEIVGENAEGPSTLLLEMQEKLRATKAVEFFERFKSSEEPTQWEVAKAPFDQHIMVNAGPGAGKTFVLVGRIAHLIREQNIDPSQIIVLAFNRAVVFEIRQRIRDLFKSLGYAAYVGRLRVSTFHSLAMRSMAREGIEITRDSVQTLLSDFATRLSEDPSFAQRVAGGARCVLVDEFQDVTDDVYRVIKHLHSGSGSRAGVMVIGDDDQDILRWQRKIDRSAHQFSEKYFDHFARDFGGDGFLEFLLGVNFRSGESIVERSQSMISGFFEHTSRSRRLKTTRLRSRMGAAEGSCQGIEWRGRTWGEAVEDTAALLKDVVGREGESTVVLCRSNAEVTEAHRLLSHTLPNLTVQGASNLRVAELRHVALWLDHLREAAAKSDAALSDDLRREVFSRMAQAGAVPEFSKPATSGVVLDHLWELCCRERSFPHLSSLIQFVEELRTDELTRLTGMVEDASTAVVSTLHKVKGLEFDNVVILPSAIQFGGGARDHLGPDLKGDAAEEARLLYVGMTRAKKNLTYYRGDRERSWGTRQPVPYEGLRTNGRVLVGSMEDVSLGWAMQHNAFNPNPDACQGYIETEVAVGDPIVLGGRGGGAFKSFMHQSAAGQWVQVGFLAKQHVAGGANAALKVSAVVRFRPDQADETLAACVRERGWGYAVLISGRLR